MKKIVILFALYLISNLTLYSQSVIGSVMNSQNTGNETVFWTMGEFVSETFESSSNILTQGFYQSDLIQSDIISNLHPLNDISVFPNPFKEKLFIKYSDTKSLSYQLFDVTGIVVKRGLITSETTSIAVNNLSDGIYLLVVENENKSVKTYQLVKN